MREMEASLSYDSEDTVTCTKRCYFYRGDTLVDRYSETEDGLIPGLSFTPSHPSHMPSYDESIYTSYEILYDGDDYTEGRIECPDSDFRVYYYFYGEPEKIEKWSWRVSNGDASDEETKNAYYAVTGKGEISDFSYVVWNDLCQKVYDALEEKGYSWNGKYASFSRTKMSSSNRTLTAARFNSLRYNVGLHYSTGIKDVKPGDFVLGRYFTTITDSLNEFIDS